MCMLKGTGPKLAGAGVRGLEPGRGRPPNSVRRRASRSASHRGAGADDAPSLADASRVAMEALGRLGSRSPSSA